MNIDFLISDATFSMEDLYLKHVEVLKRGAIYKIKLDKTNFLFDGELLNKLIYRNFVFLKESTTPPFDINFFLNQYSIIKDKKLISGKDVKLDVYINDKLDNPQFNILLGSREWNEKSFQFTNSSEEFELFSNHVNLTKEFYVTIKPQKFLNFRIDGDVLTSSLLATFEKRMLKAINAIVDKNQLSLHSQKELVKFYSLKNKHNYGFKDAYELYCFLISMTYKFNGNPLGDNPSIVIPPALDKADSSHWFTLGNILKSVRKSKQDLEKVQFSDIILKTYVLTRDRRFNYNLTEKKVK